MQILNRVIPLNTFLLIDELNDTFLLDKLLEDIRLNNEFYHTYTNVIGKHTKFNFLQNNHNFINFIKSIKKQIYHICKEDFTISGAWANIYNKNDYAQIHHHEGNTAFCGILYLTDGPGPGTYFNEYDLTVHEKKGRFVLFHSHLNHEVKKFNYLEDRITIAFNVNKIGFLDENQKVKIIK